MKQLIPYIWAAGLLQLLITSVNFFLPSKLQYRENLSKVSTIIRQIFVVHSVYIVLVLLGFSALCLLFAPELAGDSPLGRSLSGFLGVFWLLRVMIQVFYYDATLRRRHRLTHVGFTVSFLYLGTLFAIAALGVG